MERNYVSAKLQLTFDMKNPAIMKKEFLKSLVIFVPFAAFMSYINFSYGMDFIKSILFACIEMSCIFLVPYLFRGVRKRKQSIS
jgi:hypothetical protein